MTTATKHSVLRTSLSTCVNGVLWAAVFGLFVNALQLVVPLYMLQVYDRVINSHSMDTLIMLTLLAIGCLVFLASIDIVRSKVFIVIGEKLARRLSVPTLQAAIARSLHSSATQSSQPMRDLHDLRTFVTNGPVALPFDALYSPLFIGVLFVLHPAYGLVATGAALLLFGLSCMMELLVRRPSQAANEAALRAHAEVSAAIRHAEVIEAMGMVGTVARRWQVGQNLALSHAGAGISGMRILVATSRATRMAVQILMLGTGAYLVINHEVSPGTIVAATIIMGRALVPFEQLIDGWRQWSSAIGAYRRLQVMLDEAPQQRQTTAFPVVAGKLAADRIGFVPPGLDRAVLKAISFELEPGEVLGVVGPSGAGKSTLARLLVGIRAPTSGGVFLDGHKVHLWERESFGKAVGYLPQFATLLDGTVGENIARMQSADPNDIIAAARRVGAHEMIGHLPLGYETHLGENGFNLSGGQRQRIALARAFFNRPKLIILDEPHTHLDAEGENALLVAIAEAKKEGAAIVVTAHRPASVAMADKILMLNEGVVERFGTRVQILEKPAKEAGPPGDQRTVVAHLPVRRVSA